MKAFKTFLGLSGLGIALSALGFATNGFAKEGVDPTLPKEVQEMYCLVGPPWNAHGST